LEAIMDGAGGAKLPRESFPLTTGAQQVKDAIQGLPFIRPRLAPLGGAAGLAIEAGYRTTTGLGYASHHQYEPSFLSWHHSYLQFPGAYNNGISKLSDRL
jgi:hypothetical protein